MARFSREKSLNWNCPECLEELGELNAYCEYCKVKNGTIVYNPDKYFIREIRIRHICREVAKPMTPQEELFAKLFNHEKLLVKDMDLLTLRAHREELAKIAFEARARLTAVDDEETDRKKKATPTGVKGFERSLNIDETATEAINAIKERQKKLTKAEKILAGLEKLGISSAHAAELMTAGKILGQLKDKDKEAKDIMTGKEIRSPLSQENGFTMIKKDEIEPKQSSQQSSPSSLFNPFDKKG